MTEGATPSAPKPRPLMPPPEPQGGTAKAAVWSFVLALASLFLIFLLPIAIVLGHVARAKCRRDPTLKGKGLALTALIFGYGYSAIVIAAVATFVITFKSWQSDLQTTRAPGGAAQVAGGTVSDGGTQRKAVTEVKIEADPQIVQAYIDAVQKDAVHPIDRQLSDIDSEYSYLEREVFERYPERALAVLERLAADEGQYPKVRADAALILLSLDPERGKPHFQQLTRHENVDIRATAFYRLDSYADLAKRYAEWFEPLVLMQLEQADPQVLIAAIEAAACVATPAVKSRLKEMLAATAKTAPAGDAGEALVDALVEMGGDDATVDLLLRQLAEEEEIGYSEEKALTRCFEWASPQSREKLFNFLQERYRKGDSAAMKLLCAHADTARLPLIEAYLDDEAGRYRSDAFRALMRLKGEAALPLLLSGFKDKKLRHAAVAAAAENFVGSNDKAVLAALAELNKTDFYSKTNIVAAALAVSPEEIPPVVKEIVSGRAYPDYQEAPIFWHLKKITVEQALADFIEADLIAARSYAAEIAAVQADYDNYSPYHVFSGVLERSGHQAWFDMEVGTTPVPHDSLIYQFRHISRGRFQAVHIDQTSVEDPQGGRDYTYKLQWIFRDRLYSVAPEDHGDWYDLGTVIDGANAALQDHGQPERFYLLNTGDQTAQVIFGDRDKLEALATTYHLPLVSDADASMARGKAFEEEVREMLRSGEVR